MASGVHIKIGIIGGSGLDDPDILEGRTERYVDTPFGKPSDALIVGKIKNVECVLLARHGRQHTIMPSNVNYQANIWALMEEGCTHLLATTACGSLREQIQPGDIVILDQFIDSVKAITRRQETKPVLTVLFLFGDHKESSDVSRRTAHQPGRRLPHTDGGALLCPYQRGAAGGGAGPGGEVPRPRDGADHRGPALLLAGREPHVPPVGRRRHQHDQRAGGGPGQGGRAVLRQHRHGNRLRLLEGARGGGLCRQCPENDEGECQQSQQYLAHSHTTDLPDGLGADTKSTEVNGTVVRHAPQTLRHSASPAG